MFYIFLLSTTAIVCSHLLLKNVVGSRKTVLFVTNDCALKKSCSCNCDIGLFSKTHQYKTALPHLSQCTKWLVLEAYSLVISPVMLMTAVSCMSIQTSIKPFFLTIAWGVNSTDQTHLPRSDVPAFQWEEVLHTVHQKGCLEGICKYISSTDVCCLYNAINANAFLPCLSHLLIYGCNIYN